MPSNRRLPVDAADRSAVIDLVNRLNMAFDVWNIETMVESFTEDCEVIHPRGIVRGHAELRQFYDLYRPITIGVRRHNLNHIVDEYDDGTVAVTCYNMLVRVALPGRAEEVAGSLFTEDSTGLPAIVTHSLVSDTLRRVEDKGWRIVRREVLSTVTNAALRHDSDRR